MKSRLLVAAVGVPLIFWLTLWAPVWALAWALAALSGVAAYELMKCAGATGAGGPLCWLTVAWALGAVFLQWARPAWLLPLLILYCLLAFGAAVRRAGEVRFHHIMAGFFAVSAIPYAFSSFLRLSGLGLHRAFLLLPLLFSFASDTGAFFAGRSLGKHKLAPRVSPHKTVEGALGGLAANALSVALFALVMNGALDYSIPYLAIALVGLACSVVAQLGDLSFSLIKREFGIKDYGRIFLEHGGVLDRFDSVLFVAPALEVLIHLAGLVQSHG